MKIFQFMLFLFLNITVTFGQSRPEILKQEVIYYKNPIQKTTRINKAYLVENQTLYSDSTFKEEMLRLKDSSVYFRRVYKRNQPVGTWIETVRGRKNIRINTNLIRYCFEKHRDSTERLNDSTFLPKLQEEIYEKVIRSTIYPDPAKDMNLQGTVYLNFILTNKNRIAETCVTKSVHPILDMASYSAIGNLRNLVNPLGHNISFNIPIKYNLK